MNSKKQVQTKRREALRQARYYARRWFNNGWGNQIIYCYDVVLPDGSRDIGIKDYNNPNGLESIYKDNTFAIVKYNGKLTVERP